MKSWIKNEEDFFFCSLKGVLASLSQKVATHRLLLGDILVFNGTPGTKITVGAMARVNSYFGLFLVCFENLLPLFASHEISFLHSITEGFKAAKVFPASSPVSSECQRLLAVPRRVQSRPSRSFNPDWRRHLSFLLSSNRK